MFDVNCLFSNYILFGLVNYLVSLEICGSYVAIVSRLRFSFM